MNRSRNFLQILLILVGIAFGHNVSAQTAITKKSFEGLWYNKKEKRYILIKFEKGIERANINDWRGTKNQQASADAYWALYQDGKIVIYAENNDHRAPYCEMRISGSTLIYECNSAFNYTDNFINKKQPTDSMSFIKTKW